MHLLSLDSSSTIMDIRTPEERIRAALSQVRGTPAAIECPPPPPTQSSVKEHSSIIVSEENLTALLRSSPSSAR